MRLFEMPRAAAAASAVLLGALLYAGNASGAVKVKAIKMPKVSGVSAAAGKTLIATYRCNGCHGPNLGGRPGFSPNIHKTGALHDYTQAQFVTLMHTGMKNDGSHVRNPMPVYAKMPTTQAKSIFAYLETLK